ncbi:MAG: DUF523 domain-containing protein [Tissierellia bacterium]|nr:DUF523 domain-containing protein [Tissierellia bacterium]
MKEKIIISACLLGEPCRYDGKDNRIPEIAYLKEKYTLIPFCPEVSGGLPTPRPPAEIQNDVVITKTGLDVTKEFLLGARKLLALALKYKCNRAILKARSPSCGHGMIYDGSFTKTLIPGNGIAAQILLEHNIKVYSEDELEELESCD